ncbi:MAG: phosphohistidine phosphatase SixA [Betaproteobacteria bacterium RIFCSPHIGHO2_12_FULL_69_13]|nr:MAG: phosphohistidine phosphatase SixA [Betaproteobacteria bacterium RIFCSPHIGHO2_12_FULL_69_13]OGA68357.1 MAG: phosphohistidine phosphatase SixA [Betaproteobacteria bacterium RIFCSPLOWO2_12_FULL_68_20]
MDLILWRHAEAEEGGPDLERKLTAKGHKQAARIAEWLLQRLPAKFAVIASPAVRARQTAEALGVAVKIAEKLAPGAAVADILKAADWPDRKGAVVVVGHQPDLGGAAAYLLSGSQAEWTIKKGGLWWVSNRVRNEQAQVVVRAVMAPDFL